MTATIFAGPAAIANPSVAHIRVALLDSGVPAGQLCVGGDLSRQLARFHAFQPTAEAWDLAAFALAVVAADRLVSRAKTSADGWTREIDLVIAVTRPTTWNAEAARLAEIVGFLTGDLWKFRFVAGGIPFPAPKRADAPLSHDGVSLLSGGLDSLVGAIDRDALGKSTIFVSHLVRGDRQKQVDFAAAIGGNSRLLQLSSKVHTAGVADIEISQRSRSLAFLAFGVLAAQSTASFASGTRITVSVPENGFIGLNVPLTPLRAGSLSTRTTHPRFLDGMQAVADRLNLRVDFENPYKFQTKGEMLANCGNQALLNRLAHLSMSCGRGGRHYRHCGRCLPCLVRRAAFLKWLHVLNGDNTAYSFPTGAFSGSDFATYDDVLQARSACADVATRGAQAWIGPAVNAAELQSHAQYSAVAARGLAEICAFLRETGVL